MAYKLQIKRGALGLLPTGIAGEPLFTTDTNDLYIGTGSSNQKFQKFIASGTSSQFLKGDGSLDSNTYYLASNPSAFIALSALSATAPLSYNNTTGVFTIAQATGSVNGYLSSTDWTTFNNKQATLSLTTTGTSGAATLVGATLNIPQYADQFVGTVTSVSFTLGGTGTDLNSSVTSTTTTPSITLNVPTASATNRGALSSADWSTFNGKQVALNGTGFVKISGTTISYDNSTYYLASNPSAFIALTALSAGTGISYNNTTGVITNASPDQVVSIAASSGISVTGTYPSFTVASTITQYTDTLARLAISETVTGLDYNNTTGVFSLASGYVIPTTSSATNWDAAYNDKIVSAAVTGTTTKTLTLTQQDAGTITASWTDDNTDAVTSVFGRTGAVVAVSADYNTSQVTESGNLYFTDSRARLALSFIAGSGAYNSSTGAITIPTNNNQIVNGAGYTTNVGTVTSVAATAGTGITISGSPITTSGTLTITNSAPDQVVALTASTGISVSGTYPNFTITNTSPSSGGTVTSVGLSSATSGVTIGSTPITTSGTITLAIATASGSQNGLLSSTDWTTFNGKQNAITLTTTGTSGAATLVGSTLNIPEYTLSGLGGVPTSRTLTINGTSYDLSANRTWSVGTITTAAATTGGQVSFFNGATVITSVSGLYFDGVDKLGVGNSSPAYNLDVTGTFRSTGNLTAASIIKSGGTSSQFLKADGSVDSSTYYLASNPSGYTTNVGTVTSVAAITLGTTGTDLSSTVANGTTTPVITLQVPTASATNRGALSSADWTTFNNKQSTITLTTTGTSGAATFSSNTLNIPNYGSALTSYVPYSGATTNVNLGAFYINTNYGYFTHGSTGQDWLTRTNNTTGNYEIVDWSSTVARVSLTASGNLGLGVTPSAWATYPAMQILRASFWGAADNGYFGTNYYWDGSTRRYINSNFSNELAQVSGEFRFYNAPSGTAGNAITFTQAMTLTAAGRLLLGTTTEGTYLLDVNGTGRFTGTLTVGTSQAIITPTNFGYSSAYNVLAIGTGASYTNVSLNYDPSGNASASFNGTGQILIAHNKGILAPNAANNDFIAVLKPSGTGVYFGGGMSSGDVAGNGLFISTTGAATFSSSVTATNEYRLKSAAYPSTYNTSLRSDGSAAGILQFGNNNDNYILAGNTAANGYLDIRVNCATESITAGTLALRFTSGGNLLVGTTTDSGYKLNINGGIYGKGITADSDGGVGNALYAYNQVLSGSSTNALIQLATSWNTTGNADAIVLDVTNTASGASSRLLDLKVGGSSIFKVQRNGRINASSLPTSATGLSAGDIWNDGGTLKIV